MHSRCPVSSTGHLSKLTKVVSVLKLELSSDQIRTPSRIILVILGKLGEPLPVSVDNTELNEPT